MFSNYIIYLNTLSNTEKNKYLLYMAIFFITILFICGILYIIKNKFLDTTKNTLFQKILRKL